MADSSQSWQKTHDRLIMAMASIGWSCIREHTLDLPPQEAWRYMTLSWYCHPGHKPSLVVVQRCYDLRDELVFWNLYTCVPGADLSDAKLQAAMEVIT